MSFRCTSAVSTQRPRNQRRNTKAMTVPIGKGGTWEGEGFEGQGASCRFRHLLSNFLVCLHFIKNLIVRKSFPFQRTHIWNFRVYIFKVLIRVMKFVHLDLVKSNFFHIDIIARKYLNVFNVNTKIFSKYFNYLIVMTIKFMKIMQKLKRYIINAVQTYGIKLM